MQVKDSSGPLHARTQEAFGLQGGHTAGSGGGYGLPIDLVLHVASGENSRH